MNIRVTVSLLLVLGLAMAQAVPASEPIGNRTKTVENKSPVEEKSAEPSKSEIPAIAVEAAQEPKQADRAKKSASTTFCVEIRPGPSETPVKVCENAQPAPPPPPPPQPQVPEEAHEVHAQPPPPPPPVYVQEPETPIYVIPQQPSEVYIPNEPCYPQIAPQLSYLHFPQIFNPQPPPPPQQIIIPGPPAAAAAAAPPPSHQQIIIPSTIGNPCPQASSPPHHQIIIANGAGNGACGSGINNRPNAVLSLYRSAAMAPTENAWSSSMDGMMEMRSSDNEMTGMDSGAAMASGMETNENFEGENVASPLAARTHLRKFHTTPSIGYSPSSYYSQRSPYVVRCNPQLLSLGNGATAYTNPFGRGRSADRMDMLSPQARHVYSTPYYGSAGIGFPSHSSIVPSVVQHSTYQAYQGPIDSYPTSHHDLHPGYSIHAHAPSVTVQTHPSGVLPTHIYRRDQQRQQLQMHKEPMQEKSLGESKDQPKSGPMSPSQMLNQMRGNGGSTPGFNKRPTIMQSFPRVNEERSPTEAGVNVNMNFPRGGQPFMISGPRNGMDENDSDIDGDDAPTTHDELAKREVAEKFPTEKQL